MFLTGILCWQQTKYIDTRNTKKLLSLRYMHSTTALSSTTTTMMFAVLAVATQRNERRTVHFPLSYMKWISNAFHICPPMATNVFRTSTKLCVDMRFYVVWMPAIDKYLYDGFLWRPTKWCISDIANKHHCSNSQTKLQQKQKQASFLVCVRLAHRKHHIIP